MSCISYGALCKWLDVALLAAVAGSHPSEADGSERLKLLSVSQGCVLLSLRPQCSPKRAVLHGATGTCLGTSSTETVHGSVGPRSLINSAEQRTPSNRMNEFADDLPKYADRGSLTALDSIRDLGSLCISPTSPASCR